MRAQTLTAQSSILIALLALTDVGCQDTTASTQPDTADPCLMGITPGLSGYQSACSGLWNFNGANFGQVNFSYQGSNLRGCDTHTASAFFMEDSSTTGSGNIDITLDETAVRLHLASQFDGDMEIALGLTRDTVLVRSRQKGDPAYRKAELTCAGLQDRIDQAVTLEQQCNGNKKSAFDINDSLTTTFSCPELDNYIGTLGVGLTMRTTHYHHAAAAKHMMGNLNTMATMNSNNRAAVVAAFKILEVIAEAAMKIVEIRTNYKKEKAMQTQQQQAESQKLGIYYSTSGRR